MKRKVSFWIVLVLTMLTLSASVVPHHHHEGEMACFLENNEHSQQTEGDCEGESWNCVAHESYLSNHFVALEQAIPVLLNVFHLEWIPSRLIRHFFDHPLVLLPEPPLVIHQGRRAPPVW